MRGASIFLAVVLGAALVPASAFAHRHRHHHHRGDRQPVDFQSTQPFDAAGRETASLGVTAGASASAAARDALPSFNVGPFQASLTGSGAGPFHGQIDKLDTRDFWTANVAANLGRPSAGVIFTLPM